MSGRPNLEGVRLLREAFSDFSSARDSIARLESEVAAKVSLMKEQRERVQAAKQTVQRLLGEMDCVSQGNMGWEGRYFELLLMLSER